MDRPCLSVPPSVNCPNWTSLFRANSQTRNGNAVRIAVSILNPSQGVHLLDNRDSLTSSKSGSLTIRDFQRHALDATARRYTGIANAGTQYGFFLSLFLQGLLSDHVILVYCVTFSKLV